MLNDEPVKILLVDDQPAKLLSYEAMLGELGEILIRASSASEALEQLLKNEVAVVLIDVCMPELDGFELAEMIRAHPRYQRTAIILVSAVFVNDVHRLKGYHAGAVDYVGVPVVPEILRAKVAIFADLYRKSRRLERMNEELERRVEERTTALRASDRRKDEFLAILAHELRNPLAPLRNSIYLLRSSEDDAVRERSMDVMDRQLGHLVRLVDDLLDVSRITTDRLELRMDKVDLAAALNYAAEATQLEIDRREQQLIMDIPERFVVEGDVMRLTQVFANLLNNASKFSDRHGLITVRAVRAGADVEVSVRDTGEGIAPEMLPGIYDMFSQGDRSLERRHGGLGIGLTIVKRLVELHGGSVVARSRGRGAGSEFTVRIPLVAEAVAADRPADANDRWADSGASTEQRILIADDNIDSLESLAMLLQAHGNQVVTVTDGVRAVAQAEVFCPDIILLDVGMPNMNGYDACRLIRERECGRDALLIALTGWGQEEARQLSRAAGFDLHLVKPVDPDVLLNHLAMYNAKRRELRSGTSPQ